MIRGDPQNSGHATNSSGPASEPTVVWRKEETRPAFSAPIVAGEYVFTGGYALDVEDGTTHWQIDVGESKRDTGYMHGFDPPAPALSGERVFLPDTSVGSGALSALSATGATTRWDVSTDAVTTPSPVVSDGTVFTGGYHVSAYDSQDGTENWRVRTDREVTVPVAVDGDLVIGAAYAGTIYALDRATGEERWTASIPSQPFGPPVVDDERVYVSSNLTVRALDRSDGSEIWALRRGYPTLGRSDSLVVAGRGGGISGFDPSTGDEVVRTSLEAAAVGPPTIASGVVYAPTRDPEGFVAFDLDEQAVRWRLDTSAIPSPAAVAGESLYVRTNDQELVRLE